MHDLSKCLFPSHENYNPDFPVWAPYPSYIKNTSIDESIDSSDLSDDENSLVQSPKATTTVGPRIYCIPILQQEHESRRVRSGNSNLPANSSKHQLNKQQAKHSGSVNVRSQPSSSQAQSRDSHSLPAGGFKTKIDFNELSIPLEKKPVAGGFKIQARVNQPVSLEQKQLANKKEQKDAKPPKEKPNPQVQIDEILSEMGKLREGIDSFTGTSSLDKTYRYLDEMLTRLMLKLDDVNTDGQTTLRQKRKTAVREIQQCITSLEEKLSKNQAKANPQ